MGLRRVPDSVRHSKFFRAPVEGLASDRDRFRPAQSRPGTVQGGSPDESSPSRQAVVSQSVCLKQRVVQPASETRGNMPAGCRSNPRVSPRSRAGGPDARGRERPGVDRRAPLTRVGARGRIRDPRRALSRLGGDAPPFASARPAGRSLREGHPEQGWQARLEPPGTTQPGPPRPDPAALRRDPRPTRRASPGLLLERVERRRRREAACPAAVLSPRSRPVHQRQPGIWPVYSANSKRTASSASATAVTFSTVRVSGTGKTRINATVDESGFISR